MGSNSPSRKVIMTESTKPIVYARCPPDADGHFWISGLSGTYRGLGGDVADAVQIYVERFVTVHGYKGAHVARLPVGPNLPTGDRVYQVMFRG